MRGTVDLHEKKEDVVSEHPIWSEEAIAFLALADASLTVTAVKHGLKPAECVIAADPPRWSKTAAGRLGNLWIVVLAWMSPDLAGLEQTKLWFYAFEGEPETFDLDRDRVYGTAAHGVEELHGLLDRMLAYAARAGLQDLHAALCSAQASYNREQAPAVFIPPGTKGFTN